MKKIFSSLFVGLIIVFLTVIGAWLLYKNHVNDVFETKLNYLNTNWNEVLKLQKKRQTLLHDLLNKSPKNIEYSDSLAMILSESTNYKIRECDSSIIYKEYLSNKYSLPILKFNLSDKKESLEKNEGYRITNNIDSLNVAVEKYNFSVKDFNEYYSVFPNFIIGKSAGYKRKKYFDIKFGIENKDPKVLRKERREWQRKIEHENGLNE